ncbi:reverse transcriptase [Phytophthora megakarya]|uniref:Reverse transcriptase n=1 Tax=Phytophthora megakarya TaxID=4795 RepID=A0A225VBB0_9STRA|nr:reverse transcriptase [Phytophthora megakarya]
MVYRPQANGTAERMVQTATKALKMYVRDLDQKDWDKYAERLTFAIGSEEIPLTIWCMNARRWRYRVQRYYQQSREQVNARLKEAIADRADRHNEDVGSHQIKAGSRIWLYLDRVKEGYARKLAHLWHGSFRVAEEINEFSVKFEIAGIGYQIFPVVHVSKLKLVKDFPDRPRVELTVNEADRFDFDEILLPEDSWVPDLGRAGSLGEKVQANLITFGNRLITEAEGRITIAKGPIPIFGGLGKLLEGSIAIGVIAGESGGGFRPRIVSLTLQASDLRLQVPDLVPGLNSFQVQAIPISLGVVKIFTGGNSLTLEVVPFSAQLKDLGMETLGIVTNGVSESRDLGLMSSDMVSLAVLKRFHVPDVGSQLVDLQIEVIPVSNEVISRKIALAKFALQCGQPSIPIGGLGVRAARSWSAASGGSRWTAASPEGSEQEASRGRCRFGSWRSLVVE